MKNKILAEVEVTTREIGLFRPTLSVSSTFWHKYKCHCSCILFFSQTLTQVYYGLKRVLDLFYVRITAGKTGNRKSIKRKNRVAAYRFIGTVADITESKFSEFKYRQLILGQPMAIYTCNKEGDIEIYNEAAKELWGRKPVANTKWCGSSKLYQKNGGSISPEKSPLAMLLKEGKELYGEEIIIERPDAEKRYVLAYPQVIYDVDGNITGGVNTLIDITKQRQDELEKEKKLTKGIYEKTLELEKRKTYISESEDRYQKMIDEVEDYSILLLDEKGIIINWNKGAEKIKGYESHEIIGKSFEVFYRPEDQRCGLPDKLLREARNKGRSLHEGWRVRKDGSVFWGSVVMTALHNEDNNVIGFTKVTRDLTERKMAEERIKAHTEELMRTNLELKSQKEFAELILNSSVEVIVVFDTELRFVTFNKAAERIYGITTEEVIGKKIVDLYPNIIKSGMYEDLQRALKGQIIRNASYKSVYIDRYSDNYYIPLKNMDGEIYGVLTIEHDTTDIMKASEVVKRANDLLENKNRELAKSNDSLEQFAYVSSHDLQEPLRKIQTFSDLIVTRMKEPGFDPQGYLGKIRSSAHRMSVLINDLLNFSRLNHESDQLMEVDLEKVLNQVINDFELLISQKGAVIKKTELPTINAIPIQMNQLFYNLMSNALKFSGDKPEISITARMLSEKEVEENPHLNKNRVYLYLNFSDNGIGFEQVYANQIFTIFQRLNSPQQYGGTGIGLAICKKIIDNHEGYISATGEKYKGASFHVYLPV